MRQNKHIVGRAVKQADLTRAKHTIGIDEVGRAAPVGSEPRPHRYYITVGIDEVGRGPLAGPIIVAAMMMPQKYLLHGKHLPPLRDSKKLSEQQREIWFQHLKEKGVRYAVARVTPHVIDRINIARAANLAASRALSRLGINYHLPISRLCVFLDGGLHVNARLAESCKSARTVVHGDRKIPIIALASIVAKVTRDRYMKKMEKRYPEYKFGKHKGYGTRDHYKSLKRHGPSELHRLTFIGLPENRKSKTRQF